MTEWIDPERIIGCIAYPAATIEKPGVIRHIEGMRYPVGELDGSESDRVIAIRDAFTGAGFKSLQISRCLNAWVIMTRKICSPMQ